MNRKQYSKETLNSIDKLQNESTTLKASLKEAARKKNSNAFIEKMNEELKKNDAALDILKQQKIKRKTKKHGLGIAS